MLLRCLLAIPLLTAILGIAGPDRDTPEAVPLEARVAWLKKHVAPVRSIDPADEDFTDLESIRAAAGDARIVFLGEEWHGSGATFRARSRVIKFLHERCGFDVPAFESGLYDCRKTWELLREGKMPARDAVAQGIFSTWTGTEECRPFFEYLGRQARQPRPLEVCGFDCQFTGVASRRFLPVELTALFDKLPQGSLTPQQRAAVLQAFAKLARVGTGVEKEENEALAACRKALADAVPSQALPAAELAFWRQFVESSLAMVEVESAAKSGIKTERNHLRLRDEQMAQILSGWRTRPIPAQDPRLGGDVSPDAQSGNHRHGRRARPVAGGAQDRPLLSARQDPHHGQRGPGRNSEGKPTACSSRPRKENSRA